MPTEVGELEARVPSMAYGFTAQRHPAGEVASREPIRTAAAHVPYAVHPLRYININYLKGNI
ncbi:hypothetical protein B1I83_06280 [Salmonella enterica subsp. enterica serovar Muenchen]|nr:hypothetical protein [Salmonella enterica subsp. enterica serovar Muenchen]